VIVGVGVEWHQGLDSESPLVPAWKHGILGVQHKDGLVSHSVTEGCQSCKDLYVQGISQ